MRGDNDIFAASQPTPYCILGLRLQPFSLGHYFTLKRLGCGFVSDRSEPLSREDLIVACLACSMTAAKFDEWLAWDSGLSRWQKLKAWLAFVFRRINRGELIVALKGTRIQYEVAKWGRRAGAFNLEEKAKLFLEYLDGSARFPKYWVEREPEHDSGSHWSHSVLLTLTGQLGFTEARAMAMPLREALLHFFKHAESMGAVRLMTDEEISESEAAHG